MTDTSPLRTLKQVAELLATSPDRVGDLIRAGQLAAIDIRAAGARRATWRVSQIALDDFLARRTSRRDSEPRQQKRRAKYRPTY